MAAGSIEKVLAEYSDSLLALPGVVAAAQGRCDGEDCIKVFVIKKRAALAEAIPPRLGGYRVVVEETGRADAAPAEGD